MSTLPIEMRESLGLRCVCIIAAECGKPSDPRPHESSYAEDVVRPCHTSVLYGAESESNSNSLLRAELNLLRVKFDILLDTVSAP